MRTLTKDDIISILKTMIRLNNEQGKPDDIDHLGNRRIRAVGELIQMQMRLGLARMERVVRERMTIQDLNTVTPNALINTRPIMAAVREFFGGSQLSQFMDQTNPLAELTHKRRLSALGPGGLSRDRAGFDVRDVHFSHYGRICPIETPEGPNIGLIGSLATYGRINQYGFIETPYRRVISTVDVQREEGKDADLLLHQILRDDVSDGETGDLIAEQGSELDEATIAKIRAAGIRNVRIKPFVSQQIEYLSADREQEFVVAQANSRLDEHFRFVEDRVEARKEEDYPVVPVEQVDYMDVSPKQVVSVAGTLIPFLEHDDANRALMGSNMQRQAVPLLRPRLPVVGTGMGIPGRARRGPGRGGEGVGDGHRGDEQEHCRDRGSAAARMAGGAGEVREYPLQKFPALKPGYLHQPAAECAKGDRVEGGQVIADSSSTDGGELALGQNVLVAFMPWEGGNYEDAILISERLVRDDVFTSIHIEKYETEARDTKLGPEEITRDIPNVGEESPGDLDEDGVIRIGAEIRPNESSSARSRRAARPSCRRRSACCARSSARRRAR
jgi:DNA-directed RNA polymerase subunit beta